MKLQESSQPEKQAGSIEEDSPEDTPQFDELTTDVELTSDANDAVEDSGEKIDAREGEMTEQIEKEDKTETQEKSDDKNKKEYAWPIGVSWKPSELDKKNKAGEKKKLEEVKVLYNNRAVLFFSYILPLFPFFSLILPFFLSRNNPFVARDPLEFVQAVSIEVIHPSSTRKNCRVIRSLPSMCY